MTETYDTLPESALTGDCYEIYSMRYARMDERRASQNFMRLDVHDGPMPLDFFVWVLRNQERTILVDTGYNYRAAKERGRPIDFAPFEGLAAIGLPPEDVREIILTHLHYDHAGGLESFPNARIHVQDAEVEYATGRCMCESFARFPYDVEDVVQLVRSTYSDRTSFHNGDADLFPGISVHLLPGHSKGMQGVRVNTPRGPVLLASDASHFYANFMRKAPFVLTIDADETLVTYNKLTKLVAGPEYIIPGHDPKIRDLYPSITVGGIDLNVLHQPPIGPVE